MHIALGGFIGSGKFLNVAEGIFHWVHGPVIATALYLMSEKKDKSYALRLRCSSVQAHTFSSIVHNFGVDGQPKELKCIQLDRYQKRLGDII